MTDVEALIRFSQGQQPDQTIIARLVHAGLATAADGTNYDSDSKELLLTSMTEKGRKHLQEALKVINGRISDLKTKLSKIENLTIAAHRIETALGREIVSSTIPYPGFMRGKWV